VPPAALVRLLGPLDAPTHHTAGAHLPIEASAETTAASSQHTPQHTPQQKDHALPTSLDWRTHRGGGWLSAPRNLLPDSLTSGNPANGSCAAASHVAVALAAVEARVRIASDRRQSAALSMEDIIGCSPMFRGCASPNSVYAVGAYGAAHGFARTACLSSSSADALMSAGLSAGLSDSLAAVDARGHPDVSGRSRRSECGFRPTCAGGHRRQIREVRLVGGYMGNASTRALQAELQRGPLAVDIFAEPELAFYREGVYHSLQRDYWLRMRGRTSPAFDPINCHSGCTPPTHLEYQRTNYGALLLGYGHEASAHGGSAVPYWLLQLPWGQWGDEGVAKVLMGELSLEAAAVAIDPMV